jgi:hypothetical protein
LEKVEWYYDARFPSTTIENFYNTFKLKLSSHDLSKPSELSITIGNETWKYDTFDEFLAEYPKAERFSLYYYGSSDRHASLSGELDRVKVSVALPTRGEIETVFQTLKRDLDKAIIKKQNPPIKAEAAPIKIFIRHRHDQQRRDLKDHLHEKHGFEVINYEIGPRAGLSVKEVLQKMLNQSSIAFLVVTGEDETTDGRSMLVRM